MNIEYEITPHATSLPAYMGFILSNSTEFSLTEKQKKELLALKTIIMSKAHVFKENIIEMNEKLKKMSFNNVEIETIEEFNKEVTVERLRFSEIKTECRDSVLGIITETQWNKVVEIYNNKVPYPMDYILERITPIPNYMIDVYHVENLNLSEDKKKLLTNWNKDGHYDAMMMQTKIVEAEKEVRKMSLQNISKDKIMAKVEELEKVRSKFISAKTKCRDYIISNVLTEKQWSFLAEKTSN